jgi:hypothetical protein
MLKYLNLKENDNIDSHFRLSFCHHFILTYHVSSIHIWVKIVNRRYNDEEKLDQFKHIPQL